MDIQAQLEKLNAFLLGLPLGVINELAKKNIDAVLLTHGIGSANGLVLREMGNVCEGVTRVLSGEDSPNNLVAFISQDKNIDEENQPQIPALAYEIQTKIFDPVLPILKAAGLPIKEGRVPAPPPPVISPYGAVAGPIGQIRPISPIGSTPPVSSPLKRGGGEEKPPLEEKNLRALLRIAAGTTYTEGQLRDAFEELPSGLRQSISSVDTANAVQEIAKKHLLHVDQMAALASETGLVLLGLTHPADFIGNLARRLRLSDDTARDIARDISAQVLTKVREALRGLHEAPTTPPSPPRAGGEAKTDPLKRIEVMPTHEPPTAHYQQPAKPTVSSSELPATSYQLPASSTPYSPAAKWNTGDNILKKQAEEKLSREEVLRGIENPKSIYENTNDTNQRMDANKREVVGPTGWRPAGTPPVPPATPKPPKPPTPPHIPPLEKVGREEGDSQQKTRPTDRGALFPPATQRPETDTFLDQKLSEPMGLPKEEKRYTTDPYREPLE